MTEIKVAEHSGFCFGVKRAVDITFGLIEKYRGSAAAIYTYGPLIHNESVVKSLEEQGVKSIESLEDVPEGSVVVIRSHGVSKDVYEASEKKGVVLEDATCPYVARIHRIAEEESRKGRRIIIIGNENHPEVQGTAGWCGRRPVVVKNREEIEKLVKSGELDKNDSYSAAAQTTIKKSDFEEAVDYLKKAEFDIKDFCTVCSATQKRQESCRKTAENSEIMLVIGSKTSSNTMKLLEIAGNKCKKTYLIETLEDLPLNEIEKCGTIGIAAGASAPECIIKEVIATMSEFITENGHEPNEMLAYMDDIEKSLRLPGRGEIVTGEIIAVSDREIVVNLGCKKDGIIPKDEVSLEPNQKLSDVFKAGDQIEAKVVKTKDDDGNILLSKKKLEVNEHWNEVNEALENKTIVNAKVTGKVKGGVIAAFKEVSGFIPLSQLSDKFTEDVDEFIGKTIPVKVIQTNPKRNRAVFSHRAVLMEEKAKKTEAFWNSIAVDDIVDGVVKRFTDYGAFVDIGGVDGLLHISEISWGKIKKPQDVLELEEKVKVKILSMNREKGKISLGLKQTVPEPWENIESKYQVGDIIEGKVVQLKDYGAFIEIEPGLDGLVHISEIAYKRVASPANELEIGQTVNAKILDIDTEKKRISLSIKETLDKPVVDEAPVDESPVEE
ncbi:MAG: bifunctional 4-hydroxy-3-methylbut-2-enyl diphosphate reductase/30S ribosomal protein S1 [Bacillota bacterium]|nr:bifunctional 4-hydroxy-3-methylbut-2-enyl diphosphate reductase/30S ribosomal protein S1 [Bacillota bacterium]